jgi:outer membrane protein OmpA-like peptidoglycan-associated protein
MIGFGYNSSKLSAINLDMAETAKNRVYYESVIDITGHSDRTGNAKDNKDLSEKRAFTTADYIEVDRKFAKGFGDTILLFDNDLPEGRFYSRTVKIRIINTIEGF